MTYGAITKKELALLGMKIAINEVAKLIDNGYNSGVLDSDKDKIIWNLDFEKGELNIKRVKK